MNVEELAKEIDRLATWLAPDMMGVGREHAILIGFNPRQSEHVEGAHDPWWARWSGHHGTGQTCEMALLELRSSIHKVVQKAIDQEQERIANANERIKGLRAMVPSSETGETKR